MKFSLTLVVAIWSLARFALGQSAEPEAPAPIINPAVRSIVESNPATPSEKLRAADLLSRLERNDLAKPFLEQLAAEQLQPQVLMSLYDQIGTGSLVRLAGTPELNPAATNFSSRLLAAVEEIRQDESRIDRILNTFKNSSRTRRDKLVALGQLMRSGPYLVNPVMKGIMESEDDELKRFLRSVMVNVGPQTTPPLLAFLDSADEHMRAESLIVLTAIGTNDWAAYLARPLLKPSSAHEQKIAQMAAAKMNIRDPNKTVQQLRREAHRRYSGQVPSRSGTSRLWIWNKDKQAIEHVEFEPPIAASILAMRHYRDLNQIEPDDETFRLRYLISSLEAEKSRSGIDQPLNQKNIAFVLANGFGLEMTELALERARKDRKVAAACAAAEILGASGNKSLLKSRGGQPCILASALRDSNTRVRLHAAFAIMRIGVDFEFAGLSDLIDTLAHAASSTGQRRALVAHPRKDKAQSIAGILAASGIQADVESNSRDVLTRAKQSADYDFVLLSDALVRPDFTRLIQELHQQPRTANLPIGLLMGPLTHHRSELVAEVEPGVHAFPEVIDQAAVLRQAATLGGTTLDRIPPEQRLANTHAALDALNVLVENGRLQVDLTRHQTAFAVGAYVPGVAEKVLHLLSHTPSPEAQHLLVTVSELDTLSAEHQDMALQAFARSVDLFGLLLTQQQIQPRINAWSQSQKNGGDNPTVQSALRSVTKRLDF